ncbi:trypsin alpha-3-like [Hermetia illucens]|uniref:trypsin alpha-3-like n=1 Tax=Hermetia illucens TaxID=343691 RepID=UPI0018CC5FA5|nr:trypsin alpha-3-like [Hermetia illucens]
MAVKLHVLLAPDVLIILGVFVVCFICCCLPADKKRTQSQRRHTIFVGVLKWPSGESTKQLRYAVDAKIHEKFDVKTMMYDFALVRLEKPFVKTARVYPIPLATHRPEKATQCQTAAWGKKRKDEMDQYNLKYINVKPLNFEMCAFLHPSLKETSSQICAGAAGEQDDNCQGESSDEQLQCSTGPLICNGVVAGLVSATKACNKAGHYAIYADISAVKTWIDESIKEWDQLCGDYFRSGTLGTYPGLILPIYIILY